MATAQHSTEVALTQPSAVQSQPQITLHSANLPPTPPETVDGDDTKSTTSITIEPEFPLPPPANTPPQVLDIDKPTPDAHVPRDPRLVRLTGVHPFNVEAPLSALYNEGFLTSPELFYVRNHGAVPEVQDNECLDWEFSVEGYDIVASEDLSRLTAAQPSSKSAQDHTATTYGGVRERHISYYSGMCR